MTSGGAEGGGKKNFKKQNCSQHLGGSGGGAPRCLGNFLKIDKILNENFTDFKGILIQKCFSESKEIYG